MSPFPLSLLRVIKGDERLIVSKQIIDELLSLLARKFSRNADELARIAVFLAEVAELIKPRRRLHVLDDEADNRVLECAIAGKAAAIVTGDRRGENPLTEKVSGLFSDRA